ncbi:hypothetical protein mogra_94 [Escherichia phage mogra]|nr:hypothetical protein mogra_94 [Escherichia phage mogra]
MTKARFLRDTLKVLEAEAVKLVENMVQKLMVMPSTKYG